MFTIIKKNYKKIKLFFNFFITHELFNVSFFLRNIFTKLLNFLEIAKKFFYYEVKKNLFDREGNRFFFLKKFYFFFFFNKKNIYLKKFFFLKKKKIQVRKKKNLMPMRKNVNLQKFLSNTNSEIKRIKKNHSSIINSFNFLLKINDFNHDYMKRILKISNFSTKNIIYDFKKFPFFFLKFFKKFLVFSIIFSPFIFSKFCFENKYS